MISWVSPKMELKDCVTLKAKASDLLFTRNLDKKDERIDCAPRQSYSWDKAARTRCGAVPGQYGLRDCGFWRNRVKVN